MENAGRVSPITGAVSDKELRERAWEQEAPSVSTTGPGVSSEPPRSRAVVRQQQEHELLTAGLNRNGGFTLATN